MGSYHQKRVRVNYQYFVVLENGKIPSMLLTRCAQRGFTAVRLWVFGRHHMGSFQFSRVTTVPPLPYQGLSLLHIFMAIAVVGK